MNPRALAVVAVISLRAAPSFADDTPEPKPPQVVSVDYASIPTGTLPPPPAEASAPTEAPKARVTDLKLEPVHDQASVKRLRKHAPKKKKAHPPKPPRTVEIRAANASMGLLYAPNDGSSDVDGESSQRMVCGNRGEAQPLRWEKLVIGADGNARLHVDDVWFDSKSCSLWPGSSAVTTLKPVAWDDGKPWLYAVRGDASITFVMPRSSEVNAETMAGTPLTIRGAFTRVTLPVGRWGAGSMLAALPALALDARKNGDGDQAPVELSVELVQTMSERFPTLLVRTRDAVPSSPQFE